jgi:broad specificity phosphatase PhoE
MRLWLVRHGETAWARERRHTGRTDVPLSPAGEDQARRLGVRLARERFDRVFTSPLSRASETARLAGFGARALPRDELLEFDYGEYEGLTTPQIRARRPGWDLFRDGCPGGETVAAVAERVRPFLAEATDADEEVLVFGHGHALRIMTAAYLGLPLDAARHLFLLTASLSVLGTEHEWPALHRWNDCGPGQ